MIKRGNAIQILSAYPDSYFDWIYIDADHSEEGVTQDLNIAYLKVKPDGLLVFNDYIYFDHVAQVKYGVIEAVHKFLLAHQDWEMIYMGFGPQTHNDVALQRKGSGFEHGRRKHEQLSRN